MHIRIAKDNVLVLDRVHAQGDEIEVPDGLGKCLVDRKAATIMVPTSSSVASHVETAMIPSRAIKRNP
jgi:hypothetical protein